MNIDRCICYDKTFKEIYEESLKVGINTLEQVRDDLSICDRCEMCNPYIDEMFKSEIFKFDRIL
jgi:bacterioferritin-associated ferredoxin